MKKFQRSVSKKSNLSKNDENNNPPSQKGSKTSNSNKENVDVQYVIGRLPDKTSNLKKRLIVNNNPSCKTAVAKVDVDKGTITGTVNGRVLKKDGTVVPVDPNITYGDCREPGLADILLSPIRSPFS